MADVTATGPTERARNRSRSGHAGKEANVGLVWNPIGLWPLFATAVTWSAAFTLLVTRPDRPQNRWLAFSLLPEPFLFVWGSAFIVYTDNGSAAYAWAKVSQVAVPLMIFATLRFLATLETPLVSWLRARAGVLVSALLSLGIGAAFWVLPGAGVESVTPSGLSTWTIAVGPLFNLVNLPSLLLFLFGLVAAVAAWHGARVGTASRDRARVFAWAFGLHNAGVFAIVSWTLFAGGSPGTIGGGATLWFIFPLPAFMFVVLASYGVLKHQLFDIDLKIRWTLRGVSPLAVLTGIFFLVKESIEHFLPEEGLLSSLAGAGAVGVLLLPIWHVAGRFVERLMPAGPDAGHLAQRHRVYQAALEEALSDLLLSPKDRKVLDALAAQLGLAHSETSRMEAEVMGKMQARKPAAAGQATG